MSAGKKNKKYWSTGKLPRFHLNNNQNTYLYGTYPSATRQYSLGNVKIKRSGTKSDTYIVEGEVPFGNTFS